MDHTGLRVEMTAPILKRNRSIETRWLAIYACSLGFRAFVAPFRSLGIGVAKSNITRSAEACKEK